MDPRPWFTSALMAVVLMMVLPAQAHDAHEIEAWEEAWVERVGEEGMKLGLWGERQDFIERHEWYYGGDEEIGGDEYVGMGSGVERWESLIVIHFPDEVGRAWARRVMACESGGNPMAENPVSSASGLFQFLDSTWGWASEGAGQPGGSVYDASVHVEVAAWLYYEIGPSQWSCK